MSLHIYSSLLVPLAIFSLLITPNSHNPSLSKALSLLLSVAQDIFSLMPQDEDEANLPSLAGPRLLNLHTCLLEPCCVASHPQPCLKETLYKAPVHLHPVFLLDEIACTNIRQQQKHGGADKSHLACSPSELSRDKDVFLCYVS